MTQVAGPYVPQFEIYWKKLDPENTGKVDNFFVTSDQNIGDCKFTNNSCYNIFYQGCPYGRCTIPQAIRLIRPNSGEGEKVELSLL